MRKDSETKLLGTVEEKVFNLKLEITREKKK